MDNNNLTFFDAKVRIDDLKAQIVHHNEAYYKNDSPEISDFEYDELFRELVRLEAQFPEFATADSPTKKVGGGVNKSLKEVKHKYRLYSLDNSNNYDDLRKWYARTIKEYENEGDLELVTELKIDGLACALSYEKGILTLGATRGNGVIGENITENLKNVKGIPHTLPEPIDIEVRGEVYMPVSSFERLNSEQEETGGKVFANPRNALNLITTTSPSYPLMMNIEATVDFLASGEGQRQLTILKNNITDFIRAIKDSPSIMVYTGNNDPTKLLIRVASLSGQELSSILSEKFNVEEELSNDKSVLFLTGIGTTKNKLNKLLKVLKKIASDNITLTIHNNEQGDFKISEPRVKYSPAEIFNKKSVEVEQKYLIARVSMETVINYPPGIPILLPGEVIRKEHLQFIKDKETFKVLDNV